MAKKQSFSDKVGKHKKSAKTNIKFVKSSISSQGNIRFSDEIVGIPEGEIIENYLKNLVSSTK